ncbi:glycosyltransferase [Lichenibacterium minor]|uniref:Glycosyltransferase n=1 Tax=Lichenibacterium minor TaxID=2316528 RepID=A0A4V1RU04_9HYPH|nr:glycosyltransferase [Lichenibacterium minor]RYC29464.1 glycosyltransferase [Lichenibacterium minor]
MRAPAFAVNGRFLGQPVTGVQRYARGVVGALDASLARDGAAVTLLTPLGTAAPALAAFDHRAVGPGSGHAWEQLVLPLRCSGRLLNLCNTAPAARADQVVCIHDANVFRSPDSYGRAFRALYRSLLPVLAARSARIATVSHDAARQIAAHLPVAERDIAVLPNGHEHALSWDPSRAALPAGTGLDRPFVLALGSRARHKNLGLLLGLAPALDAMGLDLLVAGGGGAIFADVAETLAPNVLRLGTVSDDDLALLMDRALCLAFPSTTEGFGLPIVEAMARGCPVVSSDRASMPEICGDAALMAAPDAPDAWLAHVAALLGSTPLRVDLAGRGRERVKLFSWAGTAEGYRALMADPLAAPRRRAAPAVPMSPLPRVAVAVATRGRPEVVTETVRLLVETQSHAPLAVVVSCADPTDAGGCAAIPGVSVIAASPGLAAQRNAAIDAVASLAPDAEAIAFFDDDFVADPGWIEAVARAFRDAPDIVALTGDVLADDVKGPGLSFSDALAIVRTPAPVAGWGAIEPYSPYGCNMAFRASAVRGQRFDERLVLYGWLEDRDFAAALAKGGGRMVKIAAARGVHMGAKGGRVRGERLGYSQVVNPLYMNRKGTMTVPLVADHLARNIGSNLVGSFRPEPHVDRFGRLKGNLRAMLDVARGRIDPERAASL